MRILRLLILAFGMLGGLAGLNATANAAPLPVAPLSGAAAATPLSTPGGGSARSRPSSARTSSRSVRSTSSADSP